MAGRCLGWPRPPAAAGGPFGSLPALVRSGPSPPPQRGDHRGANPTPPLYRSAMERGAGGEDHPAHPLIPKILMLTKSRPPGRCLLPPSAYMSYRWAVADARPSWSTGHRPAGKYTHIIVSTYDGGNATQQRAPGHERPHAALCAARHGRLSAASTAPGADIPPATTAGAPGQYCQSAAPRAPGHGRPLATTARESCRDRLSAALRAPGADAALAASATPLSQHRPCAAPIATVTSPAGLYRLRQVILPRTPATPNTLTHPHSHQDTAHARTGHFRATPSPCTAGGPQGAQLQPRLPLPSFPRKHVPYPDTGRESTPLQMLERGRG